MEVLPFPPSPSPSCSTLLPSSSPSPSPSHSCSRSSPSHPPHPLPSLTFFHPPLPSPRSSPSHPPHPLPHLPSLTPPLPSLTLPIPLLPSLFPLPFPSSPSPSLSHPPLSSLTLPIPLALPSPLLPSLFPLPFPPLALPFPPSPATEVSDLNIQSTRLQQQIALLSGKADKLSGELGILQDEVRRRREEREMKAPRNLEQLQGELTKLTKELEVSVVWSLWSVLSRGMSILEVNSGSLSLGPGIRTSYIWIHGGLYCRSLIQSTSFERRQPSSCGVPLHARKTPAS